MPLARYFLYTGSVLLALLFILDWYLPPLKAGPMPSEVERSVIRIQSAQQWPKPVVIDTTLPSIVPPVTAAVAAAPEAPTMPAAGPVREAFAQASAAEWSSQPDEIVKPVKHHARRAKVARAPAGHVSTHDMFGFRVMWPTGW